MKVKTKYQFVIKRLNGKKDAVVIDEDDIAYIGSRYRFNDNFKTNEYYLETKFGDTVILTKHDYIGLKRRLFNEKR